MADIALKCNNLIAFINRSFHYKEFKYIADIIKSATIGS